MGRAADSIRTRLSELMNGFSPASPHRPNLPSALLTADFVPAAELNIELFFRYLETGVEPTDDEIRPLVERALSLVRDGMPLDSALANYRIGVSFIWAEIKKTATEAEQKFMLDTALPLMEYLAITTGRIAVACLDHTHDPRWEQLEQRRSIAQALLTGVDPCVWAREPAVSVADAYLVAVFRIGEPQPGVITSLRNRIHSLPGVFVHIDRVGWTALIPQAAGDDGSIAIDELAEQLKLSGSLTSPPQYWVGVSPAQNRAEIPDMFAEANVLAELGRCLELPEAICQIRPLLFEYAIGANSAARRRLAHVLDSLDKHPILVETLGVFLDNGLNLNTTARFLLIHRNSLSYRLSRIRSLTGFNPQNPHDATVLAAARLGRRLESHAFRTDQSYVVLMVVS